MIFHIIRDNYKIIFTKIIIFFWKQKYRRKMNISYITDIFTKVCLGVTIIGLIGNITSFLIFSRKRFLNNSMGVYCRALAITDSIVIFLQIISEFGTTFFNNSIFQLTTITCKLSTYLFVTGPPTSSWILAALSVDRIIQISFSNK